jgi:hypothetical protein
MPANTPHPDSLSNDASGIFKDHGLAKTTRQAVKVVAHLDNGKTRVTALKFHHAANSLDPTIQEWDVPTASIPAHLRALGSEFVLSLPVNKQNTRGNSMG